MATLSEMKQANKEAGRYFFSKGNSKVVWNNSQYLVVPDGNDTGYLLYKFNKSNGHIDMVANPNGDYDWQPFSKKADAIAHAKTKPKSMY